MRITTIARAAGIVMLGAGLAGCVDVEMDINVLTAETARGTMTMTIDKSMYDMMNAQEGASTDFCEDGEIIEEETVVKCVDVEEGAFEELLFGDDSDEAKPTIVAQDNGQVRVSFPTSDLTEEITGGDDDPQSQAMMAAMFEDNVMVLKVSGGPIVETNMELAADGMSASLTIPFLELINGTADLPKKAYAVVQK